MSVEVSWTTFLRDPKSVTEKLEKGDVVLNRRDGPDVRLSFADRYAGQADGLEVAASLLASMARRGAARKLLREAISTQFAWVRVMPKGAQDQFLNEFIDCAESSGELGTVEPLAQLVHEWKATATVYADPRLTRRLSRTLSGDGPSAPRP